MFGQGFVHLKHVDRMNTKKGLQWFVTYYILPILWILQILLLNIVLNLFDNLDSKQESEKEKRMKSCVKEIHLKSKVTWYKLVSFIENFKHTSGLAKLGTPANVWSCRESLHSLLKPHPLSMRFLSSLAGLLNKIKQLSLENQKQQCVK